jgi:hypothetical protein
MGEKADIDGLHDPLTERFGLRQELCRIPCFLAHALSSLVGCRYCRASGRYFGAMLTVTDCAKSTVAPATGYFGGR